MLIAIAFIVASVLAAVTVDQPGKCQEIAGNWYCSAVQAITYTNFGNPGSYQEVTGMFDDGNCTSQPKAYSGPMAPFDDEVSFHIRGPITLKQFAVYAPASLGKRDAKSKPHFNHHRHQQYHARKKESLNVKSPKDKLSKRAAKEDMVIATINGQVVSWANEYNSDATLSDSTTVGYADMVTATINGHVVSWINDYTSGIASPSPSDINQMGTVTPLSSTVDQMGTVAPVLSPSTSIPTSISSASNQMGTVIPASSRADQMGTVVPLPSPNSKASAATSSRWTREAYYCAGNQTAEGLVFLNNNGGPNSGVSDYNFGASLSYASADGLTGAATPQILADSRLEDNVEVIIFSDKPCDGDCGYTRPGTVAYHGFSGPSKAYLVEFTMPMTGKTGWGDDMPAVWILNAQIPRTLQYGEARCSCWQSGCGEWDIFEILNSGNTRAKSTVHSNTSGGESDYFDRPCDKSIKAAIIFDGNGNAGHIRILDDDAEFAPALSDENVAGFCDEEVGTVFPLVA